MAAGPGNRQEERVTVAILDRSVSSLAAELRTGRIKARALAAAIAERYAALEQHLNAYRIFDAEVLQSQAAAADAMFAAGIDLGPFQGLPVSVKDLYGLAGFRTWAGTPKPLPELWEREGPVVGAFRRQGALLAGKTHTVEFAFGGLGTNRHYGAPRNPWDATRHRVSGGSSSGAGVSLWQGTAVLALGSDTTGSVRMPASWTGTVGLKVSRGRWSCEGLLAQSETLDTPGLLARSVEDLVPAFAAVDAAPPAWSAELPRREVAGLRIGIVARPFLEDCSPGVVEGVQAALAELERAGARLVDLALPEAEPAFELWREGHLSAPEAYATLTTRFADWLPTLDPNVRTRIETFGAMPAAEYILRRRRVLAWMDAVDERLAGFEAFATPTISVTAPAVEEVAEPDDYRRHNVAASRNAAILSLFDVCAVTLPVALDGVGVPVGLQLAARRGRERDLMAIAAGAERVLGTARQRLGTPPLLAGL
jgi:aspartyl-tRNA(Asn)/glutamyl-tRNA(Gln) amidotransferase subunit A